ncbi:DUF7344 domain-containing protein [Halomicrococcus gelatinilyticus]|uniref:DUF7344 domain-containing protein n=1 Tax=Halomicrococcus gelatinilyticus TaxID=1702103 RepID=UPI002E0EB9F9
MSEEGDGDALSRDVAFEILTNPRRRYAMAYLRSQDEPVPIGELAEAVAAWERDTSVELVSSKERKSVYTSLYQTHLPKMADAGVVDYDRHRGRVALADRAEELDDYLDPEPHVPNWSRYYLALALVSGVAVACRLAGMYPFTAVPMLGYVGLVLGSFVVLSAVNLGMAHRNGH